MQRLIRIVPNTTLEKVAREETAEDVAGILEEIQKRYRARLIEEGEVRKTLQREVEWLQARPGSPEWGIPTPKGYVYFASGVILGGECRMSYMKRWGYPRPTTSFFSYAIVLKENGRAHFVYEVGRGNLNASGRWPYPPPDILKLLKELEGVSLPEIGGRMERTLRKLGLPAPSTLPLALGPLNLPLYIPALLVMPGLGIPQRIALYLRQMEGFYVFPAGYSTRGWLALAQWWYQVGALFKRDLEEVEELFRKNIELLDPRARGKPVQEVLEGVAKKVQRYRV